MVRKPSFVAVIVPIVLAVASCSSSKSDGEPGGGGGQGSGAVGSACKADGDCAGGMKCLPSAFVNGSDGYCAPSCQTLSDCDALAQTSYVITVPDTVTPFVGTTTPNAWRSSTLARGIGCSPVDAGAKYCQFACPDFAAVGADATGNLTECYCLPGYSLGADKTSCTFGTSHQCSIFTYGTDAQRKTLLDKYGVQTQATKCDACNSSTKVTDTLGCHTHEFFCNLTTTAMNGDCAEGISTAQLNQCIAQQTNFDCNCDPSCSDGCTDASNCYTCCTCSPTSAPLPKATCNPDGGAPEASTGDAGSVDAGGTLDATADAAPCPAGQSHCASTNTCWNSPIDCTTVKECGSTWWACNSAQVALGYAVDCAYGGSCVAHPGNCISASDPQYCPASNGAYPACFGATNACATVVYCKAQGSQLACGAPTDTVDCSEDKCLIPVVAESTNAACSNGADDDGNGLVDCADPHCLANASVDVCNAENNDVACSDGKDNDGNGLTDCADPGCQSSPAITTASCKTEKTPTECHDGTDNDGDGLVDCADPGCSRSPFVTCP